MLTVFTPTYNRGYIISKLYESLKNQTSDDFEWIVIDDDSNDNTAELFEQFESVGKGITYIKQPHGGKHRAINRAVKIARGEYFFIVDSDDYLTPNAVEKVNLWTQEICDGKIGGVSGLRMSTCGDVWGGKPKFDNNEYIEATNIEREKYGLQGDKAEIYATCVLKEHPFPEFENEYFVTEAVVWDWIAMDGYKLRWYNEPIYVCEYLEDGLTRTDANGRIGHLNNPRGYARYVDTEIRAYGFRAKWGYFVDYIGIAKECNIKISSQLTDLNMNFRLYVLYVIESFWKRVIGKIKRILRG